MCVTRNKEVAVGKKVLWCVLMVGLLFLKGHESEQASGPIVSDQNIHSPASADEPPKLDRVPDSYEGDGKAGAAIIQVQYVEE